MNIKNILFSALILSSLLLVSCGDKKSSEENEFSKVQKIYDKKGMEGFCKYLEKNSYLAIKDATQNDATPLLLAVKAGDLEKTKLFLEKGASAEEKDSAGKDLLDYALENSDSEAINFAVTKMPSFYWNNSDSKGNLPLVKIIKQNSDFAFIQESIDLTRNINHADKDGKTPLMYAAQCSFDVRTVKYLLDKGAKIDSKNSNEWSALMYAARYNPNPAVMEDLILRGASSEPNSVGLTITMLAACNPNPGVLLTLLKYRDEINASTDKGKTALMYACENNQNAAVIKMLIDNGADLAAKDSDGKTVREYMSANTSLTASDMGIAWKTLEENAVEQTENENNTVAEDNDKIADINEQSKSLENSENEETIDNDKQAEGVEE